MEVGGGVLVCLQIFILCQSHDGAYCNYYCSASSLMFVTHSKFHRTVIEFMMMTFCVFASYQSCNVFEFIHHLGETYPDPVRVLSIGAAIESITTDPAGTHAVDYSVEFCGGTLVWWHQRTFIFILLLIIILFCYSLAIHFTGRDSVCCWLGCSL